MLFWLVCLFLDFCENSGFVVWTFSCLHWLAFLARGILQPCVSGTSETKREHPPLVLIFLVLSFPISLIPYHLSFFLWNFYRLSRILLHLSGENRENTSFSPRNRFINFSFHSWYFWVHKKCQGIYKLLNTLLEYLIQFS